MEKTDDSILQELGIKCELLGHVRISNLSYFGTFAEIMAVRLIKLLQKGRLKANTRYATETVGIIKQWTTITTSQRVRAAKDRSRWNGIASQVMVANDQTRWICRKEEQT